MAGKFLLCKEGEQPSSGQPECRANCFVVDLSWDSGHDLDVFALLAQNTDGRGKVFDDAHILSCHNVGAGNSLIPHADGSFSTPCGTITHSGDARDGLEDDVDETITIRCEQSPDGINEILVFVAVHPKDDQRAFKGIKKSRVQVRSESGDELGSFQLSDFGKCSCLHVASIMRQADGWVCVMMGEGFKGDLNSILLRLSPSGPSSVAVSHMLALPSEVSDIQGSSRALVVVDMIPVSQDDLQHANAAASAETIQRACSLIRSFDVEKATVDICLAWGKSVNQAHSRIIRRWTGIQASEELANVRGHLSTLQDVLGSIDMDRFRSLGQEGIVARWTGGAEKARNALLEEFPKKRDEVSRIVGMVQERKRLLLHIRDRVNSVANDVRDLQQEALAFVIAGMHIANYMRHQSSRKSRYEDLAALLEGRCDTLTGTQAELGSSLGISDLSVEQLLRTISIVEQTVLVSVPAWLSNFMALQAVLEEERPLIGSDLDVVDNGLSAIFRSLKT